MPAFVAKILNRFVIFMQKYVLINMEWHDIFAKCGKRICIKLRNKHASVIHSVHSMFHYACFSNIIRGN